MYNILNSGEPITALKEYFLPAIHHRIITGKTRRYQLSVPIQGTEVVVKKSLKKIKHASFASVISGAILRMERLFHPEKAQLKVSITIRPKPDDLTLMFELINQKRFIINNEEYFLTIAAEYSYSKMDQVTYAPVLYRQVCSNGMVSMLGERFKETISVDKIFDLNCEWTRCSFEQYQRQYISYINNLKQMVLQPNIMRSLLENMARNMTKTGPKRKTKIKDRNIEQNFIGDYSERNLENILDKYIEEFGNNGLAVFNALTDYASREPVNRLRFDNFLNIGKYLQKEIKKVVKSDFQNWSESLTWEELMIIAK
jgi:hypothetical protein